MLCKVFLFVELQKWVLFTLLMKEYRNLESLKRLLLKMAEYQLFQTSSYLFETTKNVFFFKRKILWAARKGDIGIANLGEFCEDRK